MADNNDLHRQASDLVQYVAKAAGNTYEFGNLTSSIYDTAWVSMVRKPNSPVPSLLFPECFQYVLEKQLDSGGWEICGSEIDGIMNTLGGLLALKRNADIPCQLSREVIDKRAEKAVVYLEKRLNSWDVGSCDYVGFEILVPAMFAFLAQDGVSLNFPGKELLLELNQKKLARIPPSVWTGKNQTTITHSLEAFAGKIDFSGLRQQLVHGSMCSSPSSTAAYLMFSSEWDEDAEKYLRQVISSRRPKGSATGVPGMYPTTGFEVLWISCTLLDNGFDAERLEGITSILAITDEFYEGLGGFVSGFSKSDVPDADDTSRSIYIRNLLGKPTTAERLVGTFEGPNHFLTYMMERHPSVTTNCNALTAILESPDSTSHVPQIEKLAKYICASWCSPDLVFADKWNVSEFYPIMLMCDCLVRLLYHWDQGKVTGLSDGLIKERVPFVLWQALMHTLQKQNPDGSWGPRPSREITAYAVISLANLASIPAPPEFKCQIESAIRQGRSYILNASNAPDIEYIWIAKTTYSPLEISKAYILGGLKANSPKYSLGSKAEELFQVPKKELQQYTQMLSQLDTLRRFPKWRLLGCVVEGQFFLHHLTKLRHEIFDRNGMKKDQYLPFIPITLAAANNLQGSFLEADILLDMMVLILRIYQMDEYMEHIIARDFSDSLEKVKELINDIFDASGDNRRVKPRTNGMTNGHGKETPASANGYTEPHLRHKSDLTAGLSAVQEKLRTLADSVLRRPSVTSASTYDRSRLRYELRTCLLSHIAQIEDSRYHYDDLMTQEKEATIQRMPHGSYHSWLRTVAASHSCAPLSLAYLLCLTRENSKRKPSAEEQYLIQDICMHMSNKARLENDRASAARDRKEKNLNSLDFPEFRLVNACQHDLAAGEKYQLSQIVEYERKCCKLAFENLEQLRKSGNSAHKGGALEALKFYFFLTDIYSDVYSMRDISCEA